MNQQVMNAVAPEQLMFVGDEIRLLLQLIDETPTKYGKQFLQLVTAVRNKRAQEEFYRRQQETQAAFAKAKRGDRKKKAVVADQNSEDRV